MKDREEFSRSDPDARYKVFWLYAFKWFVPVSCIVAGLFLTTQKFAMLMNYDPNVIGNPLFSLKNGGRIYNVYNPLYPVFGLFRYSFNETYSYYFFQAGPPVFISLVSAAIIFVMSSIVLASHQKNQHIHGTARWANKKDLKKFGMLQDGAITPLGLKTIRTPVSSIPLALLLASATDIFRLEIV